MWSQGARASSPDWFRPLGRNQEAGASQTPGAPSPVLSLGQEIPKRLRQGLQAGEELNSVGRARGAQRDLGRNEKSKTGVP